MYKTSEVRKWNPIWLGEGHCGGFGIEDTSNDPRRPSKCTAKIVAGAINGSGNSRKKSFTKLVIKLTSGTASGSKSALAGSCSNAAFKAFFLSAEPHNV
uniref:Uncharacterized protein n=1 Tax=Romanomermis culicivorax TaxID=13658 RepID=A0A915JVX6_ROMCU